MTWMLAVISQPLDRCCQNERISQCAEQKEPDPLFVRLGVGLAYGWSEVWFLPVLNSDFGLGIIRTAQYPGQPLPLRI